MTCDGIDITKTIPDLLKEKFREDYECNYVTEAGYSRNLATLRRIEDNPIGSIPIINVSEKQLETFMRSMTHYSNSVIAKTHQQLKIELYTGMRMGEINALKIEDVDFDRGLIRINKTISRGLDDRHYLKESTKTETGTREVPMNDLIRPVFEEAVASAPSNPLGLIFYDTNKKDVISTPQVNSYFRRVCKKAGIEPRGQHTLRHSFASRCIEAGIPPVVLKTWMGHTDIHITMDTYADVFSRMNNSSMKQFEEYAMNLAL